MIVCKPWRFVSSWLLLAGFAALARAQCTPQWLPGDGVPGVAGLGVTNVNAMVNWDPDGAGPQAPKVVLGGSFSAAGNVLASNIAVYDPATATWSALGSGMSSPVRALTVLPNGDLVAGGDFTSAGGVTAGSIARWNGSSWSALGSGMNGSVTALTVLPNGDLVAGGSFTSAGGVAANRIARWSGSNWSALGSGMDSIVTALAMLPTGTLAVGGEFRGANGQVSAFFARYATPCPATATATGAACASSGGANAFAASAMPWTGATFRARGTGLPSVAFVATVTGFSAINLPLAAVLSPSPAACGLYVSPDVVDVTIPVAGAVDTQIAIPNTPSLAGVQLRQQLVALEVDAGLNLLQNTSTNALALTVGTF
jgi:hypothetical protein